MKFDLLLHHCADLGINVEYDDLGPTRHGEYRHFESLIVLNLRNTTDQMLSALAHEFGHAVHSHFGSQCNHHMADETGAALVITPAEYERAEREVGNHAGALATQLGVTRRLVLGWRRWYARTHPPRQVESELIP